MCDYSLHAEATRLASSGDSLVLHRFVGGSLGFVSQAELEQKTAAPRPQAPVKWAWSWQCVRDCWNYWTAARPQAKFTAVCIPPGAKLQLDDIPASVQQNVGVGKREQVTFTQLGYEAYTYRDAVRFANGKEILLQRLTESQRAYVLSLGGDAEPAWPIAARPVQTPAQYR